MTLIETQQKDIFTNVTMHPETLHQLISDIKRVLKNYSEALSDVSRKDIRHQGQDLPDQSRIVPNTTIPNRGRCLSCRENRNSADVGLWHN
ncbi:hypothetical protein PoB_006806400 [Plakobranchus ocellatus]|uniref:Uncharacterized protein n=1 Tax=Plakobranchus ocellatus TaxID=259542 RepID=A0AAV4DBH3_9GAST|nr:hypothetical protein PoB_006806400 [Plakobranchus ocellatus]